jgi:NSS family neurotransmitter:Na+ symporter
MLEVPVAYLIERHDLSRRNATLLAGGVIAGFSALIVSNFGTLFGWVITISTRYSQPALGILICIFAGWLWQRDALLQELKKNDVDAEQRLFWKIWPLYVKWLCPVIIGVILAQSVL